MPLTLIERIIRQKINTDTEDLSTLFNSIYIYTLYYQITVEYTQFSRACETFNKISHLLSNFTNTKELKMYKLDPQTSYIIKRNTISCQIKLKKAIFYNILFNSNLRYDGGNK